jgi:hypothetical protein
MKRGVHSPDDLGRLTTTRRRLLGGGLLAAVSSIGPIASRSRAKTTTLGDVDVVRRFSRIPRRLGSQLRIATASLSEKDLTFPQPFGEEIEVITPGRSTKVVMANVSTPRLGNRQAFVRGGSGEGRVLVEGGVITWDRDRIARVDVHFFHQGLFVNVGTISWNSVTESYVPEVHISEYSENLKRLASKVTVVTSEDGPTCSECRAAEGECWEATSLAETVGCGGIFTLGGICCVSCWVCCPFCGFGASLMCLVFDAVGDALCNALSSACDAICNPA